MGGHLVSITSLGEQQAIESIVKKGTRNIYWLGGYNSNGWKWVTGEPFSYSNWASFQPDNWDYVEDKLQMYRQSNPSASSRLGQWNDLMEMELVGMTYSLVFKILALYVSGILLYKVLLPRKTSIQFRL